MYVSIDIIIIKKKYIEKMYGMWFISILEYNNTVISMESHWRNYF